MQDFTTLIVVAIVLCAFAEHAKLGSVVVVGTVVLVGAALAQPDVLQVERSVRIAATPADIVPLLRDLRQFAASATWPPGLRRISALKVTCSNHSVGLGARCDVSTQRGGDVEDVEDVEEDESGESLSVTIIRDDPLAIDMRLVFDVHGLLPKADANFALKPEGEATTVTWTYDQHANLAIRLIGLAVDLDHVLGAVFEGRLASLKHQAEGQAALRAASEARAAAVAKAAAEAQTATGETDNGFAPQCTPEP